MARPRETNEYTVNGGVVYVDVSTKKHPKAIMKINQEDWDDIISHGYGRVFAHNSVGCKSVYAQVMVNRKNTPIHRILVKEGEVVDHINHDSLDNRRCNLRPCTRRQNSMNQKLRPDNTSGVKGVYKTKWGWQASITVNGKLKYIGHWKEKQKAINARKEAEEKYFGEFNLAERD